MDAVGNLINTSIWCILEPFHTYRKNAEIVLWGNRSYCTLLDNQLLLELSIQVVFTQMLGN